MDTWPNQLARLAEHLAAFYDDEAKARSVAEEAGLLWFDVAVAPTLRIRWENILRLAEKKGLTTILVARALEEAAGSDVGREMRVTWSKRPNRSAAVGVPTLEARLLWRRRCFINRADLRQQLALLRDGQRRILVVNGIPGPPCGKSYTRELIQHLSEVEGGFRIAYIEHKKEDGALLGPDKLAEAIVAEELGVDGAEAPAWKNESDEAWAKRVCTWIVNKAFALPDKWWIILDGLDDEDLPSATHELVGKLAARVSRQTGNINIQRLVLIDYPEARLPADVAGETVSESVGRLERSHLADYFRALLKERGDEFEEEVIGQLVDTVWTPASGLAADQQLKRIGDSVDRELRKMFAP